MRTGPKIELFNEKTIMVSEEDFERGCEIISDFQSNVKTEVSKSEYSLDSRN